MFRDDEGRLRLVYGSHAEGIWIVELDPRSGFLAQRPWDKRWRADDRRFTHVANYGGNRFDENNIEAAYIYNHPETEFYYLFVNWDRCCSGTDSTYNIRVGRSDSPTGPFLDRDGHRLTDGGAFYFSYHFYDAADGGIPSFALWRLAWVDGWPQIDRGHPVVLE